MPRTPFTISREMGSARCVDDEISGVTFRLALTFLALSLFVPSRFAISGESHSLAWHVHSLTPVAESSSRSIRQEEAGDEEDSAHVVTGKHPASCTGCKGCPTDGEAVTG